MAFLETVHQRKSAAITTVLALLLLCLLFLLGLNYYDPPIEYGMEVNFGMSTQGSGKSAVSPPESQPQTPSEPSPESSTPPPTESEPEAVDDPSEVMTQEDSPVSVAEKSKKIPQEEPQKAPEKKQETPPQKKPEKPKVAKATKNVLSSFINSKQKDATQPPSGEGDNSVQGDKGKIEGNPYASTYYNTAGKGGQGRGYGLSGRSLQSQGKVVQKCDQEGIVVVRITVDSQGNVVEAVPGVKGSTNTHPCLLKPAKETALLHRWFPDANAPERQIGFVVIQFKLGE